MPSRPLIRIEIINDIPLLKIEGRIGSTDSLHFTNTLKTLIQHEADKIILDLQKATFLDSASMGVICATHIDRQKNGKKLEILVDPSHDKFISTLFETTGLNTVLNIIRTS